MRNILKSRAPLFILFIFYNFFFIVLLLKKNLNWNICAQLKVGEKKKLRSFGHLLLNCMSNFQLPKKEDGLDTITSAELSSSTRHSQRCGAWAGRVFIFFFLFFFFPTVLLLFDLTLLSPTSQVKGRVL